MPVLRYILIFVLFIYCVAPASGQSELPGIKGKPAKHDTIDPQLEIDYEQVLRETFLPGYEEANSSSSLMELEANIDRILNDRYIKLSKCAIAVYSLDRRQYYYTKNNNKPMTPASATKLLTSFSAIHRLGKDHQVTTEVWAENLPGADSVLKGNIYLVGHGDCLLSLEDLDQLADMVREAGISKITGSIICDGRFFDGKSNRFKYSGDFDEVQAMPPITALGIEKNTVTVLVSSGSRAGLYVDVQLIPNSESFSRWITAKVRGYKGKSSIDHDLEFDYGLNSFGGPATVGDMHINAYAQTEDLAYAMIRSIRISSKMLENGKQHFTVSGYLTPRRRFSYRYHIKRPELAAGGAFKERLEAGGITVAGGLVDPLDPDTVEVNNKTYKIAEFSRPLMDLAYLMNQNSDNFIAEHMFKLNGSYNDSLDNWNGSRNVHREVMEELNIPYKGCALNDGSGLSRRNLLTAETLIRLLEEAYDSRFAAEYDSTLSKAGVNGTLEKRMKNSNAENNLRGKTGTLRNVSALTGYVTTADGEKLAYAFLFNGNYVSHYKKIEDQLGILLSDFFFIPKGK
ncbi:MAG: D-alanyl-D-alanine carboxypeptidase/D-alanyl-D-alanine-endopeptidase [Candidatus Kapaibacterium sp.]